MIDDHLAFNRDVASGGKRVNEDLMIEKLTCDDAFKQQDGFIMLYARVRRSLPRSPLAAHAFSLL